MTKVLIDDDDWRWCYRYVVNAVSTSYHCKSAGTLLTFVLFQWRCALVETAAIYLTASYVLLINIVKQFRQSVHAAVDRNDASQYYNDQFEPVGPPAQPLSPSRFVSSSAAVEYQAPTSNKLVCALALVLMLLRILLLILRIVFVLLLSESLWEISQFIWWT